MRARVIVSEAIAFDETDSEMVRAVREEGCLWVEACEYEAKVAIRGKYSREQIEGFGLYLPRAARLDLRELAAAAGEGEEEMLGEVLAVGLQVLQAVRKDGIALVDAEGLPLRFAERRGA